MDSGHRSTLVGFLLQESFCRRNLVVHRVIEHAVHGERLGEPERAERYPAVGITADRFPRRGAGGPRSRPAIAELTGTCCGSASRPRRGAKGQVVLIILIV